MNASEEMRLVRVVAVRDVAQEIRLFELLPADGRPLAAAAAGAHLDVTTPPGVVRPYSQCPAPKGQRYEIAVKKETAGRGGSASMHERVTVGDCLAIAGPRNHFPLHEDAGRALLIAGGIGITPILAMARSLAQQGKPWELHYCARSAQQAAFVDELQALPAGQVHTWFSETPLLDVRALLAAPREGVQVYCCGPVGLMEAVKHASAAWPQDSVHFEWFSAPVHEHGAERAFEVELARYGRCFTVPADKSILQVLREQGVEVASSCEAGVCGSCETAMLCGEADHRDMLLSEEERQANKSLMVCVSRAKSERIVLDL